MKWVEFSSFTKEDRESFVQGMGDVATAGDALRFVDFCKARDVDPLTCSESVFYECLDECFRADAA